MTIASKEVVQVADWELRPAIKRLDSDLKTAMSLLTRSSVRYLPESQLVKAVVEYLSYRGCLVWRQNQGALRTQAGRLIKFTTGVAGISDVIGVTPDGRFIAVECKAGKNKATPHQIEFLSGVRRRNGIAIVAYSLEDVMEHI